MRKSIISVFMAAAMAATFCAGCSAQDNTGSTGKEESSARELQILKSDEHLSQEQTLSQIKADYLKKNDGYQKSDSVVAVVSLKGDALIDSYLKDEGTSRSVGEYALSRKGAVQSRAISDKQDALVAELLRAGLISGVSNRYTAIMNGVAVETTYGNLEKIEKLQSVESVILSDTYNRPQAVSTDNVSGIVNNVDVYETGIFNSGSVDFTGKGTAVAILDSGFDCSHSVFANQPEGELWLTQQDISEVLSQTNAATTTRGLELTDVWYSRKIPFTYDYADKDNDVFPYDSEHGTHVAGIIGGKDDVITGVAVDTQLVLMKVFPDLDDGAKTDDILAALEDSVLLGVDAINMSLGSSCGFSREEDGNKINDVYDKIEASGVSLITAASNSYSSAFGGEQGNTNKVTNPDSSTVGSPSTYAAAMSVASISGVKSSYLIANDEQIIFFQESNSITGKANDFVEELAASVGLGESGTKTFEYVTVPGYGTRANYNEIDVKGKIALVRRGESTFEDKALRAKNAGAIACIIYNNVEGDISMSMGKTDHIPTISIAKNLGTALANRASGTITVGKNQKAGPFMSDFSSWGPNPNLELKPEITAHGGNIKSSIPGGDYDELSGTSMASPNLCGIVVLIRQYLKEKFPDYTHKEIVVLANRMLMSTATIVVNEDGNPYSPRKQGAGLASLYNVVNTKAYISVDGIDKTKLELKDDPKRTGEYTMSFNVVNLSDATVKYNLSVVGMTETVSSSDSDYVAERDQILGGKFTAKLEGNGSLKKNVVTVNAGETVKLTVTYKLTNADKKLIDSLFPYGMYVEGFVKLTAADQDGIDLNVPFLAFYGDWTQAPIFDKTYYEVDAEAHDGSIDDEDKLKADYYATTPYGTYFYNYIIPLGTYLYEMDSDYDYIPASEEHIAISDEFATIDGISSIYGGLLRNAKTMTYTITDKLTGEVVKEFIDYNANKAYSVGGTPIPYYNYLNWRMRDLHLTNNRVYEMKLSAVLDYGDGGVATNMRNTFEFDFYFDNEAPVLKSATYEKVYDRTLKKDRYYITLTIYDNHYVQSISPLVFTSNSSYTLLTDNPIPVYSEKGTDNVVRFEITEYLNDIYHDAMITSAIGFSIDDYALNSNIWSCQLPGTRGDFKFTKNGEYDGVDLTILTLNEGEIVDLTDYLATSDGTVDADKDYLKYLVWSSSNERVAVVEQGQVRGLAAGRSTITVTEQMELRKATLLINVIARSANSAETEPQTNGQKITTLSANHVPDVSDDSVAIESLRLSYFETTFAYSRAAQKSEIGQTGSKIFISSLGSRVSMYPGERIKLFYDLNPWYVADKYQLRFSSSDSSILFVDPVTGDVSALRRGAATVYLRVYDKDADWAGDKEPTPVSNLMARLSVTVNSEFVIENRMLVAYKGYGDENGKVVIPDDEGILYIGSFAFCLYDTDQNIELPEDDYDANKIPSTNTSIKSVVVPYGVEDIQKYAFYNCPGLESVVLPESVKFIREYAFYNDAKLASINLEHVTVIGHHAFYGCEKLNNIDLVKTYAIGESAFQGCIELAYVDLSALRNTGRNAFNGCTALKKVKMNADTKLADSMFARTGLVSVDLYATLEIPRFCFAQCKELETVVFRNDIVTIGYGAFCENDKLKTVTFRGVTAIEDQAFYDCGALTKITLPNSEFSLGNYVFRDCDKLETVGFDSNTKISGISGITFENTAVTLFEVSGNNANYAVSADGRLLLSKAGDTVIFAAAGYDFGDYTLDSKYVTIGDGAFSGVKISSIKIVNFETVIGDYAFARCENLKKVILPANGVKSIGNHAFRYTEQLTEIENLEKVKSVGDYAFANTSALKAVTLGENAEFGEGAFLGSGVATVTVGANSKFGVGAFQFCYQLTTVHMPAAGGVHFGASCFANDDSLATIDLSKHDGVIEREAFYGCAALRGSGSRIDLANVTEVGDYAFADCSSVTAIVMPKVVKIGEGAFARYDDMGGAPVIQAIDLPDTLVSIGDGAFIGCEYLEEIALPAGLEEVGDFTFAYCLRLWKVRLPDTVKRIGMYAFAGCESLADINLGKIEEFADYAFASAQELCIVDISSAKTIGIGSFAKTAVTGAFTAENLTEVKDYAFQNADLIMLNAPNLKTIGDAAFEYNKNMTEFTFSDKLEHIGIVAFDGCTKLASFYTGRGAARTDSGEINSYALLENGILYTRLATGGLELASVPAGKEIKTLEVKEGTTSIARYAGNENKNVEKIVLPDSLKSIGSHAFYGYSKLAVVEFKSVTAPALESTFVDEDLSENDPGYGLLHSIFDWFKLELWYYNFIDMAGRKAPIAMILPANADIKGYDALVYEAYFGKVENAQRSDYVAMEESLVNFIDYANKIAKIETITLADERLVNNAIAALNAIKQDATAYGYTEESWNALVTKVTEAKAQIDAYRAASVPTPVTPENQGMAPWLIAVIAVAGVVVAAGIVAAVVVVVRKRGDKHE